MESLASSPCRKHPKPCGDCSQLIRKTFGTRKKNDTISGFFAPLSAVKPCAICEVKLEWGTNFFSAVKDGGDLPAVGSVRTLVKAESLGTGGSSNRTEQPLPILV